MEHSGNGIYREVEFPSLFHYHVSLGIGGTQRPEHRREHRNEDSIATKSSKQVRDRHGSRPCLQGSATHKVPLHEMEETSPWCAHKPLSLQD